MRRLLTSILVTFMLVSLCACNMNKNEDGMDH